MPRNLTTKFKIESSRTAGTEPILEAVELSVPFFAGRPNRYVRLVNDNEDITIDGGVYVASNFRLILPKDVDGEVPSASLYFAGVNRELVKLLETTNGAQGAKCRFMVLIRSVGTPEIDFTMEINGITWTPLGVVAQLGFVDLMSRASLNQRYEQRTAAGLV